MLHLSTWFQKTDVGVGILLMAQALVEYLSPRGLKACGLRSTHA